MTTEADRLFAYCQLFRLALCFDADCLAPFGLIPLLKTEVRFYSLAVLIGVGINVQHTNLHNI